MSIAIQLIQTSPANSLSQNEKGVMGGLVGDSHTCAVTARRRRRQNDGGEVVEDDVFVRADRLLETPFPSPGICPPRLARPYRLLLCPLAWPSTHSNTVSFILSTVPTAHQTSFIALIKLYTYPSLFCSIRFSIPNSDVDFDVGC